MKPSQTSTVSFADVAHQTLIFDTNDETSRLVLALLDTPWVQRLKQIRQTGNTHYVYMFAEHSRFGHSLGVAYLAIRLMRNLAKHSPEQVRPYQNAVAAAALLHDIGHVAPGSHLAERVWNPKGQTAHEDISIRVVLEDPALRGVLESFGKELPYQVAEILEGSANLPKWSVDIISGGGWNADRGNWAIVDSTMCSVSYGRYNVFALLDAFRLNAEGELVLQESRLDALTHFFVARDSMYRQVYQHRVLQTIDCMTGMVVQRIRDLLKEKKLTTETDVRAFLESQRIFADKTMIRTLLSDNYGKDLGLDEVFTMTESWWHYHLERWCYAHDAILKDLAQSLRDRRLLKTIRLDSPLKKGKGKITSTVDVELVERAKSIAAECGFDPKYYVLQIHLADVHRSKREEPPKVLLDSGEIVPVTAVEPLIAQLSQKPELTRTWIAVPKIVKEKLGKSR